MVLPPLAFAQTSHAPCERRSQMHSQTLDIPFPAGKVYSVPVLRHGNFFVYMKKYNGTRDRGLTLKDRDAVLVFQHMIATNALAARVLGRRAPNNSALELLENLTVNSIAKVFDGTLAAAQDDR